MVRVEDIITSNYSGQYYNTSAYVSDLSEMADKNKGACLLCENYQGNPVNAATGNKFEPVTDLATSTPGIPLEFKRYYNGIDAATSNGPLGYGWTHSYSMSIQAASAPTGAGARVKITDDDGKALYFSRDFYVYTDGTHFVGESGVRDRLTIPSSGQYSGKYVLRKKDNSLIYIFDTPANGGELQYIEDNNGNKLSLTYTGTQLTRVQSNFGPYIDFVYTGNLIDHIIDPTGVQQITYAYTGGNLTGVSYPDTNSIGYAYDANHRLTDKYDLAGSTAVEHLIGHWDYDANGSVTNYYHFKDNAVNQEQIGFAYGSNTTTVTRSTGKAPIVYTTAINDGIRVITHIEGCGSSCGGTSKSFAYNQWNEVTSVSQPGYTTTYAYNEPVKFYERAGDIATMTETDTSSVLANRVITYGYTYNDTSYPFFLTQKTETKASVANLGQSKVITTTYDTAGKVLSVAETGYVLGSSSPVTYTTSYQYNTYGQFTQINGPRTDVSDITTYAYYAIDDPVTNNRGQLYRITNALGQITELLGYDANGSVGFVKDPNLVTTALTYDARNRLKTVTNQSTTALTQYFYDLRGNLSYIIFPEGNRIDYTYNLADKITQISDTLGNRITYGYDVEGNRNNEDIYDLSDLRKQLDYTYDTYNRLQTIVNPPDPQNPGTFSTEYSYDNRNNRTSARDPRNRTTSFTYDAFDRLHTMTQPLSTLTQYGYDTQDNQTSVTDPRSNATQYTYDDFGRKNRTISPDTGTTSYTYDEAGNLIEINGPRTDINDITTYTYDALNRVENVLFATDSSQNIHYTYDSGTYGKGRLTGRTDHYGTDTYTFYYDAQGNMTKEVKTVSGVSYTTEYGYNKNNALTSITYPSGRVVTYGMNTAGRVNQISAIVSGSPKTLASTITYAPFGGVTSLIYGNNLSLSQVYDNQYRISSIVAGSIMNLAYTYFADGSVQSITDAVTPPTANVSGIPGAYNYPTTSNKLSTITGPPAVTYDYDANGNITTQGTRTYVYDLSNQITSVLDNRTQIAAYTYNGMRQRVKKIVGIDTRIYHYDLQGHLIAETNAAGQTLVEYVYLGDQPLAMIRPSEQVYYYHNDHLGTPQIMTNAGGTVEWKASYNAFGNATLITETITNNIRFPGQYFDAETGLHYNWNRYYDPNTGRYITADPIGLEGGINLFGYVANDPVNWIDPWGLEILVCTRPVSGGPIRAVGGNHAYLYNTVSGQTSGTAGLIRQRRSSK